MLVPFRKQQEKADSISAISLLSKQYLLNGDFLNLESGWQVWSHNIDFQNRLLFKMPLTLEWKVRQRSNACPNYHKNKGYLPKTSATAFTILIDAKTMLYSYSKDA